MAYTITPTNGQNPIIVADGTLNTSTSLTLVGKNYPNYGSILDQNLFKLLENSASSIAPRSPVTGELFWNTATNNLSIWNGVRWRTLGSVTVAPANATPVTTTIGDLWWDSTNGLLKGYNAGTEAGGTGSPGWKLIGPQGGLANISSENISDGNVNHTCMVFRLGDAGTVYMIFSKDSAFSPSPAIDGFQTIYPGLNLPSTAFLTSAKFYGQALDALTVGGAYSNSFMRSDQNSVTTGTITINNNSGLTIGQNNFNLNVYNNTNSVINSVTPGGMMNFDVTNSAGTNIDALDIYPNGNVVANYDLVVKGSIRSGGSADFLITSTTPSYNPTTGALQVRGGAGIIGNINTAGTQNYFLGNVTAANINSNAVVSGTTLVGTNLNGTNVNATNLNGTIVNSTTVNATTVNTALANATTLNSTTISATGTISAPTITATTLVGTLATSAQGNITSLGTLTGLTVNGVTNLGPVGNIKITGSGSNTFLTAYPGNNICYWSTVNVPTGISSLTNDAGYITSADLAPYASNVYVQSTYLPLTGGTLSGALTIAGNFTISGSRTVTLGAATNIKISGGAAGQYLTSDGTTCSWAGIPSAPTNTNQLVNGAGFVYANVVNGYLTSSTASTTYAALAGATFTGTVNLGNITNVRIGGGSSGQYLQTDGAGNVTWSSVTGGGIGSVTSVAGTGTVSGITLSGTVTSTGSLTLGGTLSVDINKINATGSASSSTYLRGDGTWSAVSGAAGGTVTSVAGTGTVSGLSLSGTVTSTGSLTLGGTLSVDVNKINAIGTRDSTTYLRGDGAWVAVGTGGIGTVTSVAGTGTVSGLTLTGTVTNSGSLTLGGTLSLTSGDVTSALGFTPGTGNGNVTSVSGTGTVSGLTLSGTVTSSGSLTLGGTLSLASGDVTSALGFTPIQQGGGTGQGTNKIYAGWSGSAGRILVQVDSTDFGAYWPINLNNPVCSGGLTVNGSISATGDVIAYSSSDIRLKTDIEPITDALSKVQKLNGVTYAWNEVGLSLFDDTFTPPDREAGVIAQEVLEVLPEVVTSRESGLLAVRYEKIVPLLIEAIKELKLELDALKSKK